MAEPPRSVDPEVFRNFALNGTKGTSPFYETLSLRIADDPELLDLAGHARPGQPAPNMLFAAVQYLLFREPLHPLAAYYANLAQQSGMALLPAEDAFPAFRAFCLERTVPIRELLETRRVQTNEVRRCACLLPAFGLAAQRAGGLALALIEIGPSAGLNLLWDRYHYVYSDGQQTGPPGSPLTLRCEVRGSIPPPVPVFMPCVATRVGIDLNPVHPNDADAVLWLRALIWPEHHDRAAWLDSALALAGADPPRLIAGDALGLLPAEMDFAPQDAALCVYHSFTVNQFSQAMRDELASLLAEHSRRRTVFRIAYEWAGDVDGPALHLMTYRAGAMTYDERLAFCGSHGEWIEWQAGGQAGAQKK